MASRYRAGLAAYRIASAGHLTFSGHGARVRGGRWNSPGRPVIYASTSYACALLEILVHAGTADIPAEHKAVVITIPEMLIEQVQAADVAGWDSPDLVPSRAYGNEWLTSLRTAVLLVPSLVSRHDRNVVINPNHHDAVSISASDPETVVWDKRLFTK